MSDDTDAQTTQKSDAGFKAEEILKGFWPGAGADAPDWADTVVKIPVIPADGPLPDEQRSHAPEPKVSPAKPTLPPPPVQAGMNRPVPPAPAPGLATTTAPATTAPATTAPVTSSPATHSPVPPTDTPEKKPAENGETSQVAPAPSAHDGASAPGSKPPEAVAAKAVSSVPLPGEAKPAPEVKDRPVPPEPPKDAPEVKPAPVPGQQSPKPVQPAPIPVQRVPVPPHPVAVPAPQMRGPEPVRPKPVPAVAGGSEDSVFAPNDFIPPVTRGPALAPVVAPPVPVVSPQPPGPVVSVAPVRKKAKNEKHRRARLRVSHIDPWTVMKTAFLFSIAAGIITFVAVYVVWTVLLGSGVFGAVDTFVADILSNPNDGSPWQIENYVSTNKVLGITALLCAINVVIMTALGTLVAFLYNLGATAIGGIEVTLAED